MLYPEINEKNLRLILEMLKTHPGYLFSSDCPYSEDIKNIFMSMDHRPTYQLTDQEFTSRNSRNLTTAELSDELNTLFLELKSMLNQDMPEKEKQQWIKTSTGLLEKLLDLKKDAAETAKVEAFMDEVENILEECVSVDQRSEIINRIQQASRSV